MSRKPRCKERWICQTKNTNEEASQGLVRLLVLICSHQSLVSEEDYQSYELNLTSSKESDQTMLVHFFLQKTEQRANHPHYSFCQLKSILQNSLHLWLIEKNNTISDYKKYHKYSNTRKQVSRTIILINACIHLHYAS